MHFFLRWFNRLFLVNPSGNYSNGDGVLKSTIFEEDEEYSSNEKNQNTITEDEDISLPAFPELQYLDISSNLVI